MKSLSDREWMRELRQGEGANGEDTVRGSGGEEEGGIMHIVMRGRE